MDPLKTIFSIQRLLHRSAGQRAKKKVGFCVLDSGILSDSCRTPDFKKAPWACLEIRKKVLLKINSKLLTGIESPNPLINVKMLYPIINVQMFYPQPATSFQYPTQTIFPFVSRSSPSPSTINNPIHYSANICIDGQTTSIGSF